MSPFTSQADAVKAAREFFWGQTGTRGIESKPYHGLLVDERFDTPLGWFAIYVTAQVNKHDVLITFDTFGRATVERI